MSKFFAFVAAVLLHTSVLAQEKGILKGNIEDGDFGGPMIGANITVLELPGVGTSTDFDGNFELALDPGIYTVNVSFISYSTQTFNNVEIVAGEVNTISATLTAAMEELQAIVVIGEVRKNSEMAMLMERKNATTVSDGISTESMSKSGDSDLSGAMRRVTGVSIESGKYVYVRGLGDRYTKTTINGLALPGLDPDVNSLQMDIFPTAILENVSVSKSFSPDLDGDFTGGLVNITTRSFPSEKTTNFGVGATYTPGMHFNPGFILYNRSALSSITGFDLGQRALAFDPYQYKTIPDPVLNDPAQEAITRSFDPQMSAQYKTAYPNASFSFSHGNAYTKENGARIGYNVLANYSNTNVFYKDFEANDYLKDNDQSVHPLFKQVSRVGDVGKNNVLWSSLATGAYKKENHSLGLTLLHIQNAETGASRRINRDFNQNQATLLEDVLTYSQRSLSTGIIQGRHKSGRIEMNWANAISRSNVYDPDFRETRISITDGDTTLSTGNGSGLFRFWRNLNEWNNSGKFDVRIQLAEKAFIKTGGAMTYKAREFNTFSYKHTRQNLSDVSIDPNWFLEDSNIWTADVENPANTTGTYTIGTYQPANSYEASQVLYSGFLLADHSLFSALKLVYGVRIEKTSMYYTGRNNSGSEVYMREKTLDALTVLPSINAVLAINEKMNMRAGANKTVARPTFREKSIAQIYDPITKRTFIGNLDLEQTDIYNFDLRYEWYLSDKELVSIGGFYKRFDGHIELVSFATAPDNLKPRNSGQAENFGVEMEFRKGFTDATSKLLNKLFVSTNLTLVESRVDMHTVLVNNAGQTEYELRENNLREGEKLAQYRPMSGQSPYSLNVALNYDDSERHTGISLAYNVQGEQLSIIASGRVPDVYTIPFHSLNFNATKKFGDKLQHKLTGGVSNILNEDRTLVYRSFGSEDGIYTTYKPGVGISLSYGFTF